MAKFLKILFSFKGRLNRSKFLTLGIIYLLTGISVLCFVSQTNSKLYYIENGVIMILVVVSFISSVVRRCHDFNESGTKYFFRVSRVPVRDLLKLFIKEGTKGENNYGMPDEGWF